MVDYQGAIARDGSFDSADRQLEQFHLNSCEAE